MTATSDPCAGGLPVVDYTVTNRWSTAVLVQTWWVADASVYGIADAHTLGPAPDSATGSFSLPTTSTSASWAIPVASCDATTTTTTVVEPTTTTLVEPTTTTDNGGGNGNGHGVATATRPPPRRRPSASRGRHVRSAVGSG